MKTQQTSIHHLNARLSQLKKALRRRFAEQFQHRLPLAVIQRAVDDAEQLSQATGFPHLVFPLLAEETVQRVSAFMAHDSTPATALTSLAA